VRDLVTVGAPPVMCKCKHPECGRVFRGKEEEDNTICPDCKRLVRLGLMAPLDAGVAE
jgi:hypothetical protein